VKTHCVSLPHCGRIRWLAKAFCILPPFLGNDGIVYTYGSQVGIETINFSERQVFNKCFPAQSKLPQEGCFCSNANAALLHDVWKRYLFDEELTALEDMHLAKQLVDQGMKIAMWRMLQFFIFMMNHGSKESADLSGEPLIAVHLAGNPCQL